MHACVSQQGGSTIVPLVYRSRPRHTLPAGYGSGWDNVRTEGIVSFRSGIRTPQTLEEIRQEARNKFLADYERSVLDPCLLPNSVYTHQQLGTQGCSVLAFSHDGLMIATAVEDAHQKCTLQVWTLHSTAMYACAC